LDAASRERSIVEQLNEISLILVRIVNGKRVPVYNQNKQQLKSLWIILFYLKKPLQKTRLTACPGPSGADFAVGRVAFERMDPSDRNPPTGGQMGSYF
jgi:hypothetical protein